MKIWHQSFTVLNKLTDYKKELSNHLNKVKRSTTTISMNGMNDKTYLTEYPGNDIKYSYYSKLHSNQFLVNAIKAENDGYDAFMISSLPDPALLDTRTVVNIPVTGYGETAIAFSSFLGRRFGILLFIEELIPLLEHNVTSYGFNDKKASIKHVGFTFNDVDFNNSSKIIDIFCESAKKMIREEGAEVIIPGEAVLCTLLAKEGINRIDNVPILDVISVLVKITEIMVELKKDHNIEVCSRGYFNEKPPKKRTIEILNFYGLDKLYNFE